jgi:hypothetical protein
MTSPTQTPPATAPPDRSQLELRKLRADTEKAESDREKASFDLEKARADAAWSRKQPGMERLRILLTFLATVITLLGLWSSWRGNREQLLQDRRSKREERIESYLKASVESPKDEARLVAVSQLALAISDTEVRDRIQTHLLRAVVYERNPLVRDAIRDALIPVADSQLLADLADGSRRSRQLLARYLSLGKWRVERYGPEAIEDTLVRSDSLMRAHVETVAWFAVTLRSAINRVRVVHGQDFRNIALSVYTAVRRLDERLGYREWDDLPPLRDSLVFRNVRLDGAIVGHIQLIHAQLDSVSAHGASMHLAMQHTRLNVTRFDSTESVPRSLYVAGRCDLLPRFVSDGPTFHVISSSMTSSHISGDPTRGVRPDDARSPDDSGDERRVAYVRDSPSIEGEMLKSMGGERSTEGLDRDRNPPPGAFIVVPRQRTIWANCTSWPP